MPNAFSRREVRRDTGSAALCLYALALGIFFFAQTANALWNDENLYYPQGSRFQPDATEQTHIVNLIRAGERSRFMAQNAIDPTSIDFSSHPIVIPLKSGATGSWLDYLRGKAQSISPYHTWNTGTLTPSGTATSEDASNKNVLQSYGDTSYACMNLWLDKSGLMNCAQNWAPPTRTDYATLSSDDATGLQTHTYWIKCDGEWKYSYRYYKGCYGPANWYPVVTVSTEAPGGYVSPAEAETLANYRALLNSVISSFTASGFTGTNSGITINNLQTYYTALTEGYPVTSTGTTSGTGTTGTTSSSTTINVNVNFPDYTIQYTSGEWDSWSSTSPTGPEWRSIVDTNVDAASGTLSGVRNFLAQFQTHTDGADACDLTLTFTLWGNTFFKDFRADWPAINQAIALMKWFLFALAGVAALVIVMESF